MNIRLLILAVIMLLSQPLFSQTGKIVGKIINGVNSEPLVSASVQIKETGKVVTSDLNGNYTISNLKPGNYTLVCSYVSLATKTIDVKVETGEPLIQNIVLEAAVQKTNDVVIRGGRVNKENVNAMLIAQKNSASVSDGISAEIIRKTPDRSTSDVLKRVSGASIQEDKFAIIRGLNDRYNIALINGAVLPSTESDRKAFSFDIFPANMLDNLVIYKTATPDLPGELGGGVIAINTKDVPLSDFHSITLGIGYNTNATFKDRLTYKGGKLDIIGLDDGTRALNQNIPSAENYPNDPVTKQYFGYYIPNHWKINSAGTIPNISFQFVRGLNIQRKQKDYIGLLFSATYSRSYSHNYGIRRSNEYDRLNASDSSILRGKYDEDFYSAQTLAGVIANGSLKLNSKNIFSFKNLLSINSDDKVIIRSGYNDVTSDPYSYSEAKARWFTSNVITSSQLSGDHFLEKYKVKINWLAAYTHVRREIPNLRKTAYGKNEVDTIMKAAIPALIPGPDDGGGIFYSRTQESIKNLKIDLQRSFNIGDNISNNIKLGALLQVRNREFTARQLGLVKYSVPGGVPFDNNLLYLPEDKIFDKANMGTMLNGKRGFLLGDATKPSDKYSASSELLAAYLMADQNFFKKFRLIYGVRLEAFTQKLNALASRNDTININTSKSDLLPSLNMIYSLNKKMNFRLCYSKTLNRPEYRELAPFAFYDFVTRYTVSGKSSLRRAVLQNFDARYEFYPGRGQVISVSGFYKKFTDPIEQTTVQGTDRQITYNNAASAENTGAEMELRTMIGYLFNAREKNLLNKLTIFSNIAIIKSKVKLTTDTVTQNIITDRPLQGQSPYVFNAGLIYQDEDNGWGITISANRIGQRIFIVGDENQLDVWENGRTVIDVQMAKLLKNKKIEAKLNIKDLLAQRLYFFEDVNNNKKFDQGKDNIWSTTNYGRVISLSVSYKF